MDSNLPDMVCSTTSAWGIRLGTHLSYGPTSQHHAGPTLGDGGDRGATAGFKLNLAWPLSRSRAVNPLSCWHGMVWKTEVRQVVPTGTDAAGRRGAGGGCTPILWQWEAAACVLK